MKQAIVDRNPAIASAALVSSIRQSSLNISTLDVVKRWINEATEVLSFEDNDTENMVNYHALGFLYHLKQSDKLAVTKLVSKLVKMPIKCSFSTCFLIRMAAKLIEEDEHDEYLDFIGKKEALKILN